MDSISSINGRSGKAQPAPPATPAQPLVERVYEALLGEIMTGQLLPGTRLREAKLAERWGVSRTPIREAISRLTQYGLVETRANRSAIVRQLTYPDPKYIHQMREALEGLAAELACGRLTREDFSQLDAITDEARDPQSPNFFEAFMAQDIALHRLIAKRAGNPLMEREIRRLQDLTLLMERQLEQIDNHCITIAERRHTRQLAFAQHETIIKALRAGDAAESRRAMVNHIRASCEFLMHLMPKSSW